MYYSQKIRVPPGSGLNIGDLIGEISYWYNWQPSRQIPWGLGSWALEIPLGGSPQRKVFQQTWGATGAVLVGNQTVEFGPTLETFNTPGGGTTPFKEDKNPRGALKKDERGGSRTKTRGGSKNPQITGGDQHNS